ncbi:HSP20-like chaperone [Lactarius akahatsu]|uniref:HSP20-like chaperone n=1 Tax=Lactarius akahatsu TaxID=416441 RepID=A0AAD4LPN0_9AGAM|nr:HSP20-like chaperone [Lactarius akahatsu]
MSLTSYNFNDILSDFASLDRFFDEAFNSRQIRRNQAVDTFRPRMDVHYKKDTNDVVASFELPGLQKEDVSIDLHNDVLTVSGQSNTATERNEDGYLIRERRYGKFTRALSLPQGVKNEDIKASMANGVLTISFPKSTRETEPKKIAID